MLLLLKLNEVSDLYDLIIIGSGPAGSVAGITAARLGLKTLILEKDKKGRDKFCGGGITYGVEKFLREHVSKEISETIEIRVDGFIIFSPKGRELIVRFGEELKEYGGLVRRLVFDKKLMEIAESEGAELKEKKTVVDIKKKKEDVVVRTLDGNKYKGRYIILANGVQDKLGKKAGLPPLRIEQLGGCWGTEYPYDMNSLFKFWSSRISKPIFLFFGIVPVGYGWIFPKKQHLNIGIGTNLKNFRDHKKKFQNFIEIAKNAEVLPKNLKINYDRAWLIPFGDIPRKKTYSIEYKLLATGDAAGFVHPVTGEGLYGAVHGGALAAKIIRKALDYDDPKILKEYENLWWKEFGEDMFYYGKKIAKMLYRNRFAMEIGIRMIMCDKECVKRLSYLISHYNNTVTKKFYEQISGLRLFSLMLKSIKVPMRMVYEV